MSNTARKLKEGLLDYQGTVNKRGRVLGWESCLLGLRTLGCFELIGMYSLADGFLWREREASGCDQKPTVLSTSWKTFTELALVQVVHGSLRARGLWSGPTHYLIRSAGRALQEAAAATPRAQRPRRVL